jgi:DNA-directed RNA polymerase specialized sigma24 family protein
MAKMPDEWMHYICTLCLRMGLSDHDAEECVAEILIRYQQRRGVYPWDEDTPSNALLRMLARDVACELMRVLTRRQRLEAEYCALQHALHAQNPSPEACALANAEAEQFRESIPPHLRRTLELLEMGYTPAEIARQSNIRASTVYTYCRDLKVHFVKYFGYDPRIQGSRVGNYSGNAARRSQSNTQEVTDDAATAEVLGFDGVGVSDSEPDGDAPHLGGAERTARGGVIKCLLDVVALLSTQ